MVSRETNCVIVFAGLRCRFELVILESPFAALPRHRLGLSRLSLGLADLHRLPPPFLRPRRDCCVFCGGGAWIIVPTALRRAWNSPGRRTTLIGSASQPFAPDRSLRPAAPPNVRRGRHPTTQSRSGSPCCNLISLKQRVVSRQAHSSELAPLSAILRNDRSWASQRLPLPPIALRDSRLQWSVGLQASVAPWHCPLSSARQLWSGSLYRIERSLQRREQE
jgi:hypothetical protein